MQKVHFLRHVTSHFNRVSINFVQLAALLFPKKSRQTILKEIHAALSVSFNWASKFSSFISFLILGPTKIPSLIFTSLICGNVFLRYANPSPLLSMAFTKFFTRPNFIWRGGRYTLFGSTSGSWMFFASYFFLPHGRW